MPITLEANGEWQEVELSFGVAGHLAMLQIDFGQSEGLIEVRWITLYRTRDRNSMFRNGTLPEEPNNDDTT